jgi:hypothetical protein
VLGVKQVKRIINSLTIASAIVCVSSLVMLPISESLRLPDYAGTTIQPNASDAIGTCHAGISRGGIWFFNDELPYTGSIMNLEGSWGGKHTTERLDYDYGTREYGIAQVHFIDENGQSAGKKCGVDFPGIYYRYFDWWNQTRSWWTLRLSLWYPAVLGSVLPGWWLVQRLYRRRKAVAQET